MPYRGANIASSSPSALIFSSYIPVSQNSIFDHWPPHTRACHDAEDLCNTVVALCHVHVERFYEAFKTFEASPYIETHGSLSEARTMNVSSGFSFQAVGQSLTCCKVFAGRCWECQRYILSFSLCLSHIAPDPGVSVPTALVKVAIFPVGPES